MKKSLILGCLAATALTTMDANATAVCSGGTGASVSVASDSSNFIRQTFSAKCSANVFSNYSQNATAMGVVAGSGKGKNYFGGGTNGGGVRLVTTCATTGCSTTEISDSNSTTQMNAS